MWRSSVLLPQPLPPMMKKMLPRRTVKFRSRMTTKLPKDIVRSRTVMRASPSSPILDPERVAEDGEDAVGNHDPYDAQHDGRGGRLPHRRGIAAGVHALHAAGDGDDHPEDHALRDAQADVRERDGMLALDPEQGRIEVEHGDPDESAADPRDDVRVDTEQRHHQREG